MIESEDTGLSKNIFLYKLKPFGGNYYLNVTTLKRKYIYLYKTLFLKDVLAAWCTCIEHSVISSYRHELLWNDSNIRVEGNTIMYSHG